MVALAFFALFSVLLDVLSVGLCAGLEHISENVSLIAFLILFAGSFVVAWIAAVYVTERYFITPDSTTRAASDDFVAAPSEMRR